MLDVQGLLTPHLKKSNKNSPHTSDSKFHSSLVVVLQERYHWQNPCTLLILQLLVFYVDGYATIAFCIETIRLSHCISQWLQHMLCHKSFAVINTLQCGNTAIATQKVKIWCPCDSVALPAPPRMASPYPRVALICHLPQCNALCTSCLSTHLSLAPGTTVRGVLASTKSKKG